MQALFSEFIDDFLQVFMDDVTVVGQSFDHCLANLDKVLERCIETGLCLSWKKSFFMLKKGVVLGHIISKAGIETDPSKIEIIKKLPPPTNIKQVRSFLVMLVTIGGLLNISHI